MSVRRYGNITLTREQEEEFREIFSLVDRDGGGSISKGELGDLLRTLNLSISPQELDLMVYEIDQNNDGEIQFEEFVAVMAKKINATYTSQEVIRAFEIFEPKNNERPGLIHINQLISALTVYATDRLTSEQMKELSSQLTLVADAEGYIDYALYAMDSPDEEFLRSLTEDAAANLLWYRHHFLTLMQADIANDVFEAALSVEGIDMDSLPPNSIASSATDGATHMRKSFDCLATLPSPAHDTTESSASPHHWPSLSSVLAAVPRLLATRRACVADFVCISDVAVHQQMVEESGRDSTNRVLLSVRLARSVDTRRLQRMAEHHAVCEQSLSCRLPARALVPKGGDATLSAAPAGIAEAYSDSDASRSLADLEALPVGSPAATMRTRARGRGGHQSCTPPSSNCSQPPMSTFLPQHHMQHNHTTLSHAAPEPAPRSFPDAHADGAGALAASAPLAPSSPDMTAEWASAASVASDERPLNPGDVCWIGALPNARLPVISPRVLANLSAANVRPGPRCHGDATGRGLGSIVEGRNTMVGGSRAGQPTDATSAPDMGPDMGCQARSCDRVSGFSLGCYPGLTRRPWLVNHLWTPCATSSSPATEPPLTAQMPLLGLGDASVPARVRDYAELLRVCGGAPGHPDLANVPIPSPLCPLEAIVVSVDGDTATVEVRMPIELARQWFHSLSTSPAVSTVSRVLCDAEAPSALPADSAADALMRAQHHVIAQTGWPLASPPHTRWLVLRGPNATLHHRLASTLARFTSGAFLGSDAVRHIVCRVEGLPQLDPYARRRVLARVLGLDGAGRHVIGTGCDAVLSALRAHPAGSQLIGVIGAVSTAVIPPAISDDAELPASASVAGVPSVAAEQQWTRVEALCARAPILALIAPALNAAEVCSMARLQPLLDPAHLLACTREERAAEAVLCRRLRALEFSGQGHTSVAIDDNSNVADNLDDGDANTEEVEATTAISTVGRFYFRRCYVPPRAAQVTVRTTAKTATMGATSTAATIAEAGAEPYEWHSGCPGAPDTRITATTLTAPPTATRTTTASPHPSWRDHMRAYLRHYASAPAHPMPLPFPTADRRGMHPQANHNPLPHAELALASRILAQLPQLNASQRTAIMLVLNQSLTLVQGPPGTGKTQTITVLVWLWVCALGRKLPSKLPGALWPEEHLAAAAPETTEPDDGPTYTTAQHTPLSASDVARMVSGTLDSAAELNACMAPKLGQARGTVDLRAHTDFAPALPAACCDLLVPLSVSGRGPVLVSAYTNVAVDEICARLLALPGFRWDSDAAPLHTVVRVGAGEKMDARLQAATVAWQLERDDEYKQWCVRVEEEHQADVQRQADLAALMKYVRRVLQTLQAKQQQEAAGRTNARALVAPVEHSTEKRALMDRCGYALPTHMSVERAEEDLARLQRLVEHASRCPVRRAMALKEARRASEFRILQRASVVVGTCVGVASPQLDGLYFSLIVVDECSQVPEPACLLPISKLAPCSLQDLTGTPTASATAWRAILSDPTAQTQSNISRYGLHPSERSAGSFARVVLVGDQCQLAPVVPRERVKLLGAHVSLFERLLGVASHAAATLAPLSVTPREDAPAHAFFHKYYTNNPNCPTLLHAPPPLARCAVLRTQYRMHAALAQWISTHIYHRRVASGTHPAHRKCPPGFPWPTAIAEALVNPSKAKKHAIGRSIATQLFAFEAWARQVSPGVSPGRLAQALLCSVRAQPMLARVLPQMERQMPAHVPHRSMADAHAARKRGDAVAMFAECCGDGAALSHGGEGDALRARGCIDTTVSNDIPPLTTAGAHGTQTSARTCAHPLTLALAQTRTRARDGGLRLDEEVASHVLTHMLAQPPIATLWRKTTVKCHPSACAGLVRLLPVVFVDVPFAEDARTHQSSKRNVHEAQLVAHIVASLTGALPVAGDLIHGHVAEVVGLAVERAHSAAVLPVPLSANTTACPLSHPHVAEDPDEHHLAERVGSATERAALYRLLAHTWLGAAVAAAQGPRVTASEIGVVTPYAGQVRAVVDALATLRSSVDARERELATCHTSLASADTQAAANTTVDTSISASANASLLSPAVAFDARSVEVRSVDGFQGREKEVIIVSCVRSNDVGELGFVADIRRLNVAISRAKRGLIIVGNQRTLRHDATWASYLDTIAAAGGVVPYATLAPWLRAGVALPNFME